MTDFCEFERPSGDCQSIAMYVQSIVESAATLPRIQYTESVLDADSDSMTALWAPCDPPDCATVVWFNTTSETFTVWSYISSTWHSTGSTGLNTPYYTEFTGQGGPIQEEWSGTWIIDGSGNVHPSPVLGEELLSNPDMEDWALATIPDDWSSTVGTISEENTIIVNGDSSTHALLTGGAPFYNGNISQNVTVAESLWFKLSAYMYGPASLTAASGMTSASNWVNTTVNVYTQYLQWEKLVSTDFSITTTGRLLLAATSLSADNVYWDTASFKQIVSGYQITKEFYSAYGTFYVDYILEPHTHFGILLNYQDADNFAMVVANQAKIFLVEVDTGAASITNSWAYTYVAGARLEVIRDSSDNVTIDYNSVNVVTDEALVNPLTATIHGIVGTSELSSASAFGYTPE